MSDGFRVLATCIAVASLAACGGNNGSGMAFFPPSSATPPAATQPDQPGVSVEELPSGSYIVSLGDENAPTVGKYYAAEDGSRLLVVADDADHAIQLYRRAAGQAWVSVPAAATGVSVKLLRHDTTPATVPAMSSLAGSYIAQVAADATTRFTVSGNGEIAPGASACKLAGKFTPDTLPGTMKIDFTAINCGALPRAGAGVVTFDRDYAPASFRLVTDNGSQPVELWAFSE